MCRHEREGIPAPAAAAAHTSAIVFWAKIKADTNGSGGREGIYSDAKRAKELNFVAGDAVMRGDVNIMINGCASSFDPFTSAAGDGAFLFERDQSDRCTW